MDEALKDLRKNGIGGSDVAAILGKSRYNTSFSIWSIKTGRSLGFEGNNFTEWGNRLEEVIANTFAEKNNVSIRKMGIRQHKDYDIMFANIDRFILNKEAILEIKTSSAWNDEFKAGIIPIEYVYQIQHYMYVLNKPRAILAVLIGGNDYREFEFERDTNYEKETVPELLDWWERHIVQDVPPPRTYDDFAGLLADCSPAVSAGNNELLAIAKIKQLNSERKRIDVELDRTKAIIMDVMNTAERLISIDGKNLATWKNQESSRVDSKKLQEKYPEAYAECSNKTISRVMRIN